MKTLIQYIYSFKKKPGQPSASKQHLQPGSQRSSWKVCRRPVYRKSLLLLVLLLPAALHAQTSWRGLISSSWWDPLNWTAGVPGASVDAIIGDASFIGLFQPSVTTTSSCKSLIIGGTRTSTLTVSKGLTISGNVTINSGNTLSQKGSTLTVNGNWTNNGTYTTTTSSAKVTFSGTAQTIAGTSITGFRQLTIGAGSTVTLNVNATVSGAFLVSGTFIPAENASPRTVTGAGTTSITNGGILKVNASTYNGNYGLTGSITLSTGSIVDYSATLINQTVRNTLTYSTLRISGTGTKTLAGNLNVLNATSSTSGIIEVLGGVLDLSSYTANRGTTVVGGSITVANNAMLRIGGTGSFPLNYNTHSLGLTSTVEYAGAGQAVSTETYGNLTLSGSSGAVVKTMPATSFTVSGNLTSMPGAATSVSFAAASNFTISGNVNIGASTTFSGGSFTTSVAGNWVNNGIFNGSSGTVRMTGGGTSISGSGTHNFNNLTIAATNVTAATSITVAGNLASLAPGTFTQATGGTLTMSGASKTITGTGFTFDNLTITGSISVPVDIAMAGNLVVNGSINSVGGAVTMSGTTKTISGTGTITFGTLVADGTITTTSSFSISSALDVSGNLTATAGTITFSGNSFLDGNANLYNVTLSGTSLQLSSNAVLGIAGSYTVSSGSLNVTASVPNTVNFNGTGAQTIPASIFDRLTVSGAGTKTLGGLITVHSDFTIAAGTTFNGASQTLSLEGNWVNSGNFSAASGTVTLAGAANTAISGTNTFNILNISKTNATTQITLLNNITASLINMNTGMVLTGNNTLTITNNRSGNGIILGNIQRSHAFTLGTSYAFESPNNTISLASLSGAGSITVSVVPGVITGFPLGASINREYTITASGILITGAATLRFHYEDAELNGNNEATIGIWRNTGSGWAVFGKSANSTTTNYVEYTSLLSSINGHYTLSATANVVTWNGSVSSDWSTAANWTVTGGAPSRPPGAGDIAEIGTAAFTSQPVISSAANVKGIVFGSVQATTLTLASGGSLITQGNITGSWSANAVHTINTGSQSLTVNGDLALSDGASGHSINLNIGSGTVTIAGSLTQAANTSVSFSGAGTLNIGGNYNYTGGTFTAGSGTVIYNGASSQTMASISYNHLTISKTGGTSTIGSPLNTAGNLSITGGTLAIGAATTVSGNITIGTGATLNGGTATLSVGGNWNNSGIFTPATGTVSFTGGNEQTITATTFNNLIINKTAASATLTGNATINGNTTVSAGTLNLSTFTANRSSPGGTLTIANGAAILAGGTTNFPASYSLYSIGSTSTVTYNGAGTQTVAGNIAYGHLIMANGGTKTLAANCTVNGNLTINSGASFGASTYTISLYGNWSNNGIFTPGSGTITLNGNNKTITGNTTFNKLTAYGGYAVGGSDITYNGLLLVATGGSYDAGSGTATVNGDLTNNGSLVSNGITTFTGTSLQTIRFVNAIVSNSSGVINFNGNISPVLNSTSPPTFATLNVNNTAGINPSVGWNILVAFNIAAGASFNGGISTHNIRSSFTNNGIVTSTGTLNFNPATAQNIQLQGTSFSSTGTVIFGGAAALNVTGTPTSVNDVVIANTAGVTPAAGWNIAGDFYINGSAIFNAGANTFTVGGDLESNGTLNGGTSTFTLTSADGALAGSPGTTFYNLAIIGNTAAQANFNVAHNFSNNGSFDATNATMVMIGSSPSLVSGTASPFNLAQLEIQKASGAITTLGRSLREVAILDITSGTLDLADSTVIQDATEGGALSINDSARLLIRGTNSLPVFNTYALDTLSTVEYAGTTQTISANTVYGNLTISAAGVKNATAALCILNNFTLSNGNFVPGNFTDTVRGNWNMTGGTFVNTGSTIYLAGAAIQQIYSTGAFNHLTVNDSTGIVSLSSNITVNGTLTFTKGRIRTGTFTLIMPATGTVSGAAQATGWVYGRLQKNIATGSGVTRAFEVGDSVAYTPAIIVFANVSTAGNLLGTVTRGDHPNIVASGIASDKDVNRYWSFTNNGVAFTTASVTLNWLSSDIDAGAATSSFRVGNYNGTNWSLPAVNTPQSTSIQATGLATIGDLIVGELSLGNIWTGAISTNWYTNGNWSATTVPTPTINAIIPSGLVNYPLINTGTATVNNITIQTGASVTVSAARVQIGGSISSSGTFNAASGTIELNGAAAQTIAGSTFSSNRILHLTINNPANVTLTDTLNISGILRVSAGQLNTGNHLTLLSTATQTALIDGSGTGQVTGNLTIQRYLASGFGYKYFSAPFQAAKVSEFADDIDLNASFPSFYWYEENRPSTGWVAYTDPSATLTPMQGYAAQMGAGTTPRTVDITGTVNNGTVTAPAFSNNNQPYTKGFNLVGNPYPSPIDWDAAAGWSRTNIDNAIYYFNAGVADQYGGIYSSYINGVSSDGVANNVIATMQGFFVHVTDGAFPVAGTLSINNASRINNLSPNFYRQSQTASLLRLTAAFTDDGDPADAAVIYFDDAATSKFEKDMDALKLMNTDSRVPNLYTIAADSPRLSICAWPKPDSNDVIPLGLKIERTGWITFNAASMERIPPGWRIYLHDNKTGLVQDLQERPQYRLQLTAGSYEDRFSITFKKNEAGPPAAEVAIYWAFSVGRTLYGYFDKVPGNKCRIAVSNLLGQVLWQGELVGGGRHELGSQYSSGLYIVSFYNSGGQISKKVFISNQ
ncbi:hypothetical protein [Chitinophaga sp. MM2321]|uniref:hypothetical protein n=1 Tax=Chitinophaga sp. MM2321 TaxID=3137178 RepID=UPI0032D59542